MGAGLSNLSSEGRGNGFRFCLQTFQQGGKSRIVPQKGKRLVGAYAMEHGGQQAAAKILADWGQMPVEGGNRWLPWAVQGIQQAGQRCQASGSVLLGGGQFQGGRVGGEVHQIVEPGGLPAPFRIDLGILLPPFPLGGLHKAYKAGMQIGGTAEQFLLQQPGGI